jgi:diguanylate cyclase (GGDEF)-like protein
VSSWDETVRELRDQYLAEAQTKLDEIGAHLERLAADPRDAEALEELVRRFHGFAGSGTSYGFPGVTALGGEAEDLLRPRRERGEPPDAAELTRACELLGALRRELAQPTGAAQARSARGAAWAASRPFEVLVVDDDPAVVSTVGRLLEQEGIVVRRAADRQQALAAIAESLPDGLVVDIVLPDGSGYELVETVRARPDGEAPAIVIVSVRTGFLDRVEAIHCGADAFFEKPVDWEALLRRMQMLLDRTRAEPARVLSVEDDPSQAEFLRAVLTSGGYKVRVTSHPSALEADLASFRPDLILMDIRLPGVDGYALSRLIRQDERYAALPIVFLSTEGEVGAQIRSVRAGGDEHLVKPVDPALLLSTVAARIERARFLKSLLNRDGLTRLLTHTAFLERARGAVARKRRDPGRRMAWVMVDLDSFKAVNDIYGHPAGDRVIVALSSLLRRRVRQSDTVGRYGGEEFALLLEDLDPPDAVRLLDRLREEFAAMEVGTSDGRVVRATFSAGVAFLAPGIDLDPWRKSADDALYRAKTGGRNQVALAAH